LSRLEARRRAMNPPTREKSILRVWVFGFRMHALEIRDSKFIEPVCRV
jgi:hypothetical protein